MKDPKRSFTDTKHGLKEELAELGSSPRRMVSSSWLGRHLSIGNATIVIGLFLAEE